MLKTQINPHFLFNTLNNLYGLTKEHSPAAPELILRLSALLRHSVYQGARQRVALDDEISYLKDYIALQQIRYAKQVQVRFEIEQDRDDYAIAPLLLIVLLENAYKHGVEPQPGEAELNLNLSVLNGQLSFELENNYDPTKVIDPVASGMGLRNLSRRLELEYPNRHRLEHGVLGQRYRTSLQLGLDAPAASA
nr:histidine kinase [Pseudomarimonas arenosa]